MSNGSYRVAPGRQGLTNFITTTGNYFVKDSKIQQERKFKEKEHPHRHCVAGFTRNCNHHLRHL